MATEKLGRYEILSELGQGAMGVVYKAIDPLIERTVAIKTIRLNLSKDELDNFEERFYREAKSAGRLNHPNIVTIYDIGKSENSAYMAMEFMEGRLLRDILDTHTALSIDKIVDIAAQIADGLAYAHEHGIVHRDIKPANIMLVRDDVAKIMDFGIAQMPSGSRTLAGTVLGSPKYMSPEQIIGKTMDGRTDIFALGVILYEMLTGEPPFDGDNINTIMYRIINENPPPPKSLAPRLPEAFNFIIAKALHKDPEQRYQNAREMATALRNYNHAAARLAPASLPNLPSQPKAAKPRPKPTTSEGDATVFIKPSLSKTHTTTPTRRADNTPPLIAFAQQYRKPLIVAAAALILAFSILMMHGKTAPPKNRALAVQRTGTTAPIAVIPLAINKQPQTESVKHNQATDKIASSIVAIPPKPAIKHHKPPVSATTSKTLDSIDSNQPGKAVVNFAISPWGEIYIDGKEAGISPPIDKLTIPAGKHKIEIKNAQLQPYSETVDLKAASSISIKHIFR